MSWRIVPQIEKHGKDQEEEVLCKAVRFTPPVADANGNERFIPLRFPSLKVIIEHNLGSQHFISWSHRHTTKNGMFTYKWNAPGVKSDQYIHAENFWSWMRQNRPDVAEQVKSAFEDRMREVRTPRPKKTKARVKKLSQTEILALVSKGELTPEQGADMLKAA